MPAHYSFVTDWYIRAPLQQVWDAIYLSEEWPEWWKGVLSVQEIVKGDERGIGSVRTYKLISPFHYVLSFNLLLTERTDLKHLKGIASGDLEGTGEWRFESDNGITHAQCIWEVSTTIGWMNTFAFLLRPVFSFNHRIVMKQGAKSLSRKLNAELINAS